MMLTTLFMTCQCLKSGGVSDGGVDHFYINKGSNLYLNYDFAKQALS